MKSRIRLFCMTAAILSGVAVLVPDALFAGPKLPGPGRRKVPKMPMPGATASTTGFEVGPDEMTNYQVDPKSSINEVVFTSTAPKETIKGKTTKATGHLDLNPRKLDSVAGGFSVAWSDVDTGNKTRNGHMMDAPWVNAKSHPKIEFAVKSLELSKTQAKAPAKSGKEGHAMKGKLIGTMSMNGKDKEMKIPVTLAYVEAGKDKDGNDVNEGIGVKARFSIALADFDIKGKGVGQAVAKSQKVKISLFLAKSAGTSQDKTSDEEKKDEKKKDGEPKES